jgi:hypothetical protein
MPIHSRRLRPSTAFLHSFSITQPPIGVKIIHR